MAKYPRIFQKIFGSTAPSTDIGVFGGLAAGSVATGTNLNTLQSLSQFTDGWKSAILGNNSPAIEDMNALFFVITSQLAYILQAGVSEWQTDTAYYTGGFVNYNGVPYRSLQDNQSGNQPDTSPTYWQIFDTNPSGLILPFAGIVTPSNYGPCDGGMDSRTDKVGLFNALTLRVTGSSGSGASIISSISTTAGFIAGWPISGPNIQAGTLITSVDSISQIHISKTTTGTNTGAAFVVAPWGVGDGSTTFNRPEIRGRGLISAGAGSGLTARLLAAQLGEETHVLSTGEMPSHNHSATDAGHHHAIGYNVNGQNALTGNLPVGPAGSSTFDSNTATANVTIGNTGGGGAHNNMQPSVVTNFIIKY